MQTSSGASTPLRPPFGFTLTAPSGWTPLRLDPELGDDQVLTALSATPAWSGGDDEARAGIRLLVEAALGAEAVGGVLASWLHTRWTGEHLEVATLTLTWLRTAPALADLDVARLVLPGGEEVATGVGVGLAQRTSTRGGQLTSFQVAAPVEDSVWLAVLSLCVLARTSGASGEDVVLQTAMSLRVDRVGRSAAG